MCRLNNLDVYKARAIYKNYPKLIKNIVMKMGRIEYIELSEFNKAFGPNFAVCLKDSSDGFRMLITSGEFVTLYNNRSSKDESNINLFLCDYDFELFREVIYLDEIESFL